MAVHSYECLFLLDPNKSSSDWQAVMKEANGLIEKIGGEIIYSRPWGEPKLTYPIRKFRKGAYLLTYFKVDSKDIPKFEAECRLCEVLLRHLVVKLHPKIAEEIIQQLLGQGEATHHERRPEDSREPMLDNLAIEDDIGAPRGGSRRR